MFANDGILSKRLVLILIRVYQQRSAWHCADTDFINNKKCKWKIWQEKKIFKTTDSCKSCMNFQNVIKFELWLHSLLSKLAVHSTAVLTAIMSMIYKLPVRNQICLHKNLDHKHCKEHRVHSFFRDIRALLFPLHKKGFFCAPWIAGWGFGLVCLMNVLGLDFGLVFFFQAAKMFVRKDADKEVNPEITFPFGANWRYQLLSAWCRLINNSWQCSWNVIFLHLFAQCNILYLPQLYLVKQTFLMLCNVNYKESSSK